jgi:tellurite methyltransferase
MDLRAKWDTRYRDLNVDRARPARVLSDNVHLLPTTGCALDVASGPGGNAVLLARLGFNVTAYDFSCVAIDKLNAYARYHALPLCAQCRDVEKDPPAPKSFDVVVIAYFLDRQLTETLIAALRPGGLLFYQTFIRDYVNAVRPGSPAFRLKTNELLILFSPLKILFYREEGSVGDTPCGFRNEALLVGQKPGHRE